MQYTLYHASVESFTYFDVNKIKAEETDAYYNGFWFSSDKYTSPSFRNPNYLKKCIVTLNNPAPHEVINKLVKQLWKSNLEGYRSVADATRLRLQSMGYDGIIFNDIPQINEQELYSTGETTYVTPRGHKYKLKLEEDGIDLYSISYYGYENYITGYCDLEDFLNLQEQTIVVFSNNQIEILEEIKLN